MNVILGGESTQVEEDNFNRAGLLNQAVFLIANMAGFTTAAVLLITTYLCFYKTSQPRRNTLCFTCRTGFCKLRKGVLLLLLALYSRYG